MPLVGGFFRGSPVSPAPSFRRRSIFTSITLIGSEDLDVKSHPNLCTHSLDTLTKTGHASHTSSVCLRHRKLSVVSEVDERHSKVHLDVIISAWVLLLQADPPTPLTGAYSCGFKVRNRKSDTGDNYTHALCLIAPTRNACSVSVVTLPERLIPQYEKFSGFYCNSGEEEKGKQSPKDYKTSERRWPGKCDSIGTRVDCLPSLDRIGEARQCTRGYWSTGLLGDLPFHLPLHSGAAPYPPRFTLIGSRDLDVKSSPNIYSHSFTHDISPEVETLKPAVPLAQRIARWTSNPKVVGLIPARDAEIFCTAPWRSWSCAGLWRGGFRVQVMEPMRLIERRKEGAWETGDPQENPSTSGIVPHEKIRSGPAGDGTRFTLVGGKQASRSATAVHMQVARRSGFPRKLAGEVWGEAWSRRVVIVGRVEHGDGPWTADTLCPGWVTLDEGVSAATTQPGRPRVHTAPPRLDNCPHVINLCAGVISERLGAVAPTSRYELLAFMHRAPYLVLIQASTRPGTRAGIPAAMEHSYNTTAVRVLAFGTLSGCAVCGLYYRRTPFVELLPVKPMRLIERRKEGAWETGDPQENPSTSGIVPHEKIRSGPAGDGTRFTLVGGKQASRSATAVHMQVARRSGFPRKLAGEVWGEAWSRRVVIVGRVEHGDGPWTADTLCPGWVTLDEGVSAATTQPGRPRVHTAPPRLDNCPHVINLCAGVISERLGAVAPTSRYELRAFMHRTVQTRFTPAHHLLTRGGLVVRQLASHSGELGIVLDDTAGRRDFPFPLPLHSGAAPRFTLIGSQDLDDVWVQFHLRRVLARMCRYNSTLVESWPGCVGTIPPSSRPGQDM
ncbi:hypothetical protein PR048_032052 [Dryococelus australis]|uniref:Uncharacterized protein n=1 Tax=Dryococelus australis TaxID=614101 RepID=A0ABQ9G160_9NEOP|nr:hypothetical protein PR048_032052 [Dryococelus australis]